jgi:hypothetical protein
MSFDILPSDEEYGRQFCFFYIFLLEKSILKQKEQISKLQHKVKKKEIF